MPWECTVDTDRTYITLTDMGEATLCKIMCSTENGKPNLISRAWLWNKSNAGHRLGFHSEVKSKLHSS